MNGKTLRPKEGDGKQKRALGHELRQGITHAWSQEQTRHHLTVPEKETTVFLPRLLSMRYRPKESSFAVNCHNIIDTLIERW